MADAKFREMFERDISKHQMQVIRDDGVSRHIRFKRPDTISMHFDLITWPGMLCYTGDMGTYVFRRLEDMFQFFRCKDCRDPGCMDLGYWAEKVEAQDRHGKVCDFSPENARLSVDQTVHDFVEDNEVDPVAARKLREDIDEIFGYSDDGETVVRDMLHRIECDGMCPFENIWEWNFDAFTHRFVWCCYAIEWGIGVYDAAKEDAA